MSKKRALSPESGCEFASSPGGLGSYRQWEEEGWPPGSIAAAGAARSFLMAAGRSG